MAKLSYEMTGIKELQAIISQRPALMATRVQTIVAKNGAQLQATTKRNMRNAYTKGNWTGKTAGSTKLTLSRAGMTATVAPGTDYFPYLEYGTRFMPAKPTLKPAFAIQSIKFANDLKNLMQ